MEDTTMLDSSVPVFNEATFTIIPTSLAPERVQKLTDDIKASGGTMIPFDASTGRIERLEQISYIVSVTTDFPDYYSALDSMINVVKPSFVDACIEAGKLKNPRSYNPDPAMFMSEVVVCCGDIPEGDQDAIAGGVIAMGGQFSTGLTKTTTHLVALSEKDRRYQLACQKNLKVKTVLPHWFDDCLRVGRKISERPYLLPDPEIMNVDAGAIPAPRTNLDIRDATNPEPADEPTSTPPAHIASPRKIKAFAGRKLKLGADLNINARLKGTLTDLIEAGDGFVTKNINEADIYICNYRDGDDYVKASQEKKDVGNLSWLYYLITHDEWTNPMRRMLHYPRPRNGIPGFENYKISISSYTGEARVFLENLIRATGAEFTKTFKQDNTHLIAAHKTSEKYEAAQEWGVNVVNNLWLEDCYAHCQVMPLSKERYIYFPTRTNMGEILGSTEMDRAAVEKIFFPKNRKPQSTNKPTVVPASSATLGRGPTDRAARGSPLIEKTSKRTKAGDDVATPAPSRRLSGKENETPGTTGSRGAKAKALTKIHDSAPDVEQYMKESKRKGGVVYGGRRRKEDEVPDKSKRKGRESTSSKRSIDEVDTNDGTTEEDEATEPVAKKSKKARKSNLVPIKYRMLISKDMRWVNKSDQEAKDKVRMRELGVFITDDYKQVDLLLAPKIVRTEKFVSALACGPTLVSPAFLDYALKHNKIPDPAKYPLDTSEYEAQHNMSMDTAIARAEDNKHRLLKGWQIFCTPNVTGGFDTFKNIIEANGGACIAYRGRSLKLSASRREIKSQPKEVSQNLLEDDGDVLYLISEIKNVQDAKDADQARKWEQANKTEVGYWEKFREFAEKNDMVPRIASTDWILSVAIAQKMMWKEEWELNEEMLK
ncbi:hypothetical protein CC80DRAFT_535563 [Byssothecium circinans]|uniref:BRCT domain-containing protein n=1 Tax=Byssothecium circinans TaxID=147558 RepID=A0A6A5U512_9PLEO|nr:hypothetical protein CC80DRAFT_535563 [Byssothecium circinans]